MHSRQVFLGHDRKAATKRLAELKASTTPILPGQYSVSQLVALFVADCQRRVDRNQLKPETLKTHRSYLLRWAEACRRLRPENLRVFHLDRWVESHETWNSTTIATAISRVKLWSRWVKRKGLLDFNHLQDAQAPQRLTRDPAEPGDLAKFEAAITCPRFLDFYHVLHDTGCRPGEIKSITASSVQWERSTAIVRGKSGERLVGLTTRALGILRRCALVHPEGSLLKSPGGTEWSQSTIKYHWQKVRRVADVPDTLTPYHLRHALWNRWHAAGIADIVIARQLGHTKLNQPHVGLLMSTYAHAGPDLLAEAAHSAESSSPHAPAPKRARR